MEQKTNEGWEKRYSNLLTPGTRIMAPTAQEAMSTHNTREGIEWIYKKIDDFYRENFDESQPRKKMYVTELLHQELQKAREEERERIYTAVSDYQDNVNISGSDFEAGFNEGVSCLLKFLKEETLAKNHQSELDQPKEINIELPDVSNTGGKAKPRIHMAPGDSSCISCEG